MNIATSFIITRVRAPHTAGAVRFASVHHCPREVRLNAAPPPGPGTVIEDIHTALVKEHYNHTIHGYDHITHTIITVCHLLAMVPLSIDVRSKVMSDTVRNAEDQSMHRTAALQFVEYLETPPSTNGIPSLASLLQVYVVQSSTRERCSTWSFTNFRSQTACNKPGNKNRQAYLLFFPGKAPYKI